MAKRVVVKIAQLIAARGISLRELSRRADIRHAALSELANQKRQSINLHHIERIAEALDVQDIREIIDLTDIHDGGPGRSN